VVDFRRALYGEGLILDFGWLKWGEELERYQMRPEPLEEADLLTIWRILTAHAHKGRFVEGHLVGELKSGHILAVLRRCWPSGRR
jgi:hypothetical protein